MNYKEECYILALDLGTSSAKIGLIDRKGHVIEMTTEPYPIFFTENGGAEQNPEDWWKAFLSGAKKIIQSHTNKKEHIKGISISAQWSGTVCVDKEGNPIRNAISWMDTRGAIHVQNKIKTFPSIEGYNIFQLMRFINLTGGAPTHSGKDPIAHILYLKEEEPEIYKKTFKFLEPKDFINLKLTGKYYASYDSITLHWLTDNRNIYKIYYHPALLRFFNIEKEKLPELIPPCSVIGTILPEVAKQLELRGDVKVVSGTPDIQSAIIGSGAVKDYEGHIYIGTSSWISTHVPFKKTDLLHNMASLPAALPGKYFVANDQETAGYSLTYFIEKLLFPDDILTKKMNITSSRDQIYEDINEIARQSPPGSNGVIFTPWLLGERTPVEDHFIRAGFYNISVHNERSDFVRAIFEGVAFNNRWLLIYIEKFIKRKFDYLNFIGGGAKSDLWCQILADVLNKKIRQVENPVEANLRGAGLLGLYTLNYITLDDISIHIPIRKEYEPVQENVKLYNEIFKQYLEIYKKNKLIYKNLNKNKIKG
ncbi:MAG: carbohydrate kinase [Leptospiraceae bacterium]|nr:MAG: carbohydrate kinase [Leptospiraceae bacterium]